MRAWRTNPEHLAAQKLAREKFYASTTSRSARSIARVEHSSREEPKPRPGLDRRAGQRAIQTSPPPASSQAAEWKNSTMLEGVAAPLKIDQCRHRHDHPQAVSEDDQAHRARQGPVLRDALQATTAARTRISCSTSRPTARPRSWSPTTISAAAPRASTRPGR